MIPARATVVTLGTHDMASMRAFYRGLGWREGRNSSDEFASFLMSGAILGLFPFEHLVKDARVEPSDVGTYLRLVRSKLRLLSMHDEIAIQRPPARQCDLPNDVD